MARTPLAGRSADLARLGGAEITFPAQVDVRAADGSRLGFPTEPNTWARAGDREVLWLGPDEWLVVVAAEMIALRSGLGYLIIDSRNAGNRYDLVVAGMVIIGLTGLLLDAGMRRLERLRAVRWRYAR